MMRHQLCVPLVALGLLVPWRVQGLGVRIPDQDPFAVARGNAFVATADNPSAIYYNPAGITQLEKNAVQAGVYAITLQSTYTSAATGRKTDSDREFQGVPQIYYAHSFDALPVSAGLGLYAPYGLSLNWPDDTGFRTLAKDGSILYLSLNPVAAWRILPTLSVAAGLTLNYSEAKLSQGTPAPLVGELKFKGDDTDVGFNLGLLWQPDPKLSFGASYRSPTTLDYSGHTNLVITAPFGLSSSGSAKASFHFPRNAIGGVSYRPTTNWNFEVDIDWTDWDSLNSIYLKPGSGPAQPLPFGNWRSSFLYEVGVTRYFQNGFHLSGGYIFSENSVPDTSFNPAVPDSDRHIFGLGVGGRYKQLHWDAAYQFAWGPSRTINNPAPAYAAANGSYEFFSHALTVSLGYTF